MKNRKWVVFTVVLAIALACVCFIPSQRGWAPAALVSFIVGFWYNKYDNKLVSQAGGQQRVQMSNRLFVLLLVLAVAIGIANGLVFHWKWWTFVPAILSLVFWIIGFALSIIVSDVMLNGPRTNPSLTAT